MVTVTDARIARQHRLVVIDSTTLPYRLTAVAVYDADATAGNSADEALLAPPGPRDRVRGVILDYQVVQLCGVLRCQHCAGVAAYRLPPA